MKILVIHNYHRKGSSSGDDQVFKNETDLLEKYGNKVIRYTVSNDSFDSTGIVGKIFATFGMLWSFKHYNAIKKIMKEEKPDIVHVHTFFPLLSPSILYAAKKCGVKVVATLHDTRFICPCATSLRNFKICNECLDGHYFRMSKYNCYKGSKLQSIIIAGIFKYHRMRKSFYRQIDRYICLNENQIKLLVDAGFDNRKIIKKYNFVPEAKFGLVTENKEKLPERYVVFYGRIGEEKGIRLLMEIWEKISDIPLVVMGTGPLEKEFKDWAYKQEKVYFLGYTEHDRCLSIVKNSEFVIFTSICYEGCSMVEIESESLGKGLVVTDLGFSSEAIENGVNGFKIKLGDINGFVDVIRTLWNQPQMISFIGKNARSDYELKYLPEDNYKQILKIYTDLIEK